MTSSKSSKVSGAGCRRETKTVARLIVTMFRMHSTIWNVVLLSKPVEISSANNTFLEPTIISPAVTQRSTQRESPSAFVQVPVVAIRPLTRDGDCDRLLRLRLRRLGASPVVTRFFCPPEMPLTSWSPMIVSSQICKQHGTPINSLPHEAVPYGRTIV